MSVKVMLVSVGGGVSEGILGCLARHRPAVTLIGVTSQPDTPAARLCDRVHKVAPLADAAGFARDLLAVLAAERPAIAFPCRDEDLPALALLRAGQPELAAPLLVGPPAWAEAMRDKLAMARFAADHGVPMAETAADPPAVTALAARHGFPLIAKPRRGSGTRGVYVVATPAQLEHCLRLGGMAFQPYIAPPPDLLARLPDPAAGHAFTGSGDLEDFLSVRGIVDKGGRLAAHCLAEVQHRFGRPFRLALAECTPAASALAAAMAAGLGHLGYRGPFGAQCRIDHQGRLTAFEMLSRIGGSTLGFAMQGYDETSMTVSLFTGAALAPLPADQVCGAVEWLPVPVPRLGGRHAGA
ncbi:MAG: hypothetical protein OHK0024_31300 [Thalassobaculales bacterium]